MRRFARPFRRPFERVTMEAKPLPPSPDETSSFYIQATESIQERWPRILKSGDTFGMFDALGDVIEPRISPGGLFHNDTRHLSGLEFLINGQRPVLLASAVENDNVVLTVDRSNPDIYEGGKIVLPRETLHVRRSKFLWLDTAYERFAIHNFDTRSHRCIFTFNFAADFRDLFEIRGIKRARRGEITTQLEDQRLTFRYQGLDGITRVTDIHLDPKPHRLRGRHPALRLFVKEGGGSAPVPSP